MKKYIFIILAAILTLSFSCKEDCPCDCGLPQYPCGDKVIILPYSSSNTRSDNFTITGAQIIGDSLRVDIASSGCAGSTWKVCLFDSGAVMESYPEQRLLWLTLENREACDAVPTRSFAFDIAPLQIQSDKIYLNLQGWNEKLLYDY
ncbi:hypothetical protein [Saccharicrinis sp. 156]|uniref:hypothetical protein n=1 Tax=Saccharicrinis sp. 156 TaxID=3417574 RepID=UPI003D347EED